MFGRRNTARESRNIGPFAVEFVLIVAGVLVALAVDDWRQSRADLATEQYILRGILEDLGRDRQDISAAISAARARASAADSLLTHIGSAAAGRVTPTPLAAVVDVTLDSQQFLEGAQAEFPHSSMRADTALRLLTVPNRMQRVNVSTAAFTEGSASGALDTLRDVNLRAELAAYYYDASRFGTTVDQRVDDHWAHLRAMLAAAGLASDGAASAETILATLRGNEALVAEIINARELAVYKVLLDSTVLDSANALAASVEQALRSD